MADTNRRGIDDAFGVVDEKPQGAQHAGWFTGLRIRHPPAADRLFDGAPDLRSVEIPDPAAGPLSQLSSFTCEHSFASGARASPVRAASPRNITSGATSRSFFKRT